MTRVLVASVGMNPGPLESTLRQNEPDRVVFVCSRDSRKVAEEAARKTGIERYPDFIELENENDPPRIFSKLQKELPSKIPRTGEDLELVFDITGGTKSMSAALYLATIDYPQSRVAYQYGPRGKDYIVVENVRQIEDFNPFRVFNLTAVAALNALYREGYFSSALSILGSIKRHPYTALAEKTLKGFLLWDKFRHQKALEELTEAKRMAENFSENETRKAFSELAGKLKAAIEVLQRMDIGGLDYLKTLDLYYNAKRRHARGEHEDAIARYYRLVEYCLQRYLSEEYGVKTGGVDKEALLKKAGKKEKEVGAFLESRRKKDGKIKLALHDDLALLHLLKQGHPFHSIAASEEMDALDARNNCLLAHGFQPATLKTADAMERLARKFLHAYLKQRNAPWQEIAFPSLSFEFLRSVGPRGH